MFEVIVLHSLRLFVICAALALTPVAVIADDEAETRVDERLERRVAQVREEFSDVRHVRADALDVLEESVVFIDVRDSDEFAVSRIPGARHAASEAQLLEIAEQAEGRKIVLYCSLGVRSSIAARALIDAGHEDVVNLDGSLFAWANAGRPLENDDGPTNKAHPYNAWWGRYLRPELRSYNPQ